MIKLNGSRFTDIMPDNLAGQLETQAFAYALSRQIETLCAYADGLRIYAAIASMPEKILDILAVELRTPAYRQDYDIEIKRALVEGTLEFYAHLGTPAACNRMIEIIFQEGHIEEWYQYGGRPHHFRVLIGRKNMPITPEDLKEFREVLCFVKRLSSWLDEIITTTELEPANIFVTPAFPETKMVTALPELRPATLHSCAVYVAPYLGRVIAETRLPLLEPDRGPVTGRIRVAAAATTASETKLPMLTKEDEIL